MNVPLLVAGSLALVGAAIHGGAGEMLVVSRLSPRTLPASPFGGPRMTKTMIRVTWHIATIAFVTIGCALLVAGSVLHGATAQVAGVVGAGAGTAIAALVLGAGGMQALHGSDRRVWLHPAPALCVAVTSLAWWGVARAFG